MYLLNDAVYNIRVRVVQIYMAIILVREVDGFF